MTGRMTTPTKKAVRPSVSTTGSIAPTRISDRTASRTAAPTRTTAAVRPGPGRTLVASCGCVAAEGRGRVRELVDQRQDVAGDQEDRDEHGVLDDAALRLPPLLNARTAGTNRPIAARTSSAAFDPAISRLKVWRAVPQPADEDAQRRGRAAGCR